MLRTIFAITFITAALLWLPLWVQLALFIIAAVFIPYRLALFIPAAFGDALYAPHGISLTELKYTFVTMALIIVHWLIIHKTRVKDIYAVETT